MNLLYVTASTEDELQQILALQRTNHSSTLVGSPKKLSDGFVTVMHTLGLLTQMNKAVPQVIARDEDKVIGYALVMLKSFASMIPILQPMFDRLATITYGGVSITDYKFYVMGQICIDERYRGRGVFDSLYNKHKELLQSDYELCVTSVSTRNQRSMRAHERVGFETVNTFVDSTDEWNILVWKF